MINLSQEDAISQPSKTLGIKSYFWFPFLMHHRVSHALIKYTNPYSYIINNIHLYLFAPKGVNIDQFLSICFSVKFRDVQSVLPFRAFGPPFFMKTSPIIDNSLELSMVCWEDESVLQGCDFHPGRQHSLKLFLTTYQPLHLHLVFQPPNFLKLLLSAT